MERASVRRVRRAELRARAGMLFFLLRSLGWLLAVLLAILLLSTAVGAGHHYINRRGEEVLARLGRKRSPLLRAARMYVSPVLPVAAAAAAAAFVAARIYVLFAPRPSALDAGAGGDNATAAAAAASGDGMSSSSRSRDGEGAVLLTLSHLAAAGLQTLRNALTAGDGSPREQLVASLARLWAAPVEAQLLLAVALLGTLALLLRGAAGACIRWRAAAAQARARAASQLAEERTSARIAAEINSWVAVYREQDERRRQEILPRQSSLRLPPLPPVAESPPASLLGPGGAAAAQLSAELPPELSQARQDAAALRRAAKTQARQALLLQVAADAGLPDESELLALLASTLLQPAERRMI